MRFQQIQSLFSDISSRVQENLAGVRVVRAYVQEEAEIGQFERLNQDYIKQNLRSRETVGTLYAAAPGADRHYVHDRAVGRRATDDGRGNITLGSFVMFNTFMGMLVWPMIAFGWVVNLVQRGTASLKRIDEILEEEPRIKAPAHPEVATGRDRRDRVSGRWCSVGVTARSR